MPLIEEQWILIVASLAAGCLFGALVASLIAMRKLGAVRTMAAVLESQLLSENELTDEREQAFQLARTHLLELWCWWVSTELMQEP